MAPEHPPLRRTLLERLGRGPISGQQLADELGVSRTAVWKHVETLREEGVGIEGTTHGYRIVDVPEYGAAAVEYELPPEVPFNIEYHRTIGSTNDRARSLAEAGAEDAVVLADRQTAGRGRRDRHWVGPPGGIYLSVVLRPNLPPTTAQSLQLAGAVATAAGLEAVGVPTGLKWPNDVLARRDDGNGGKLAGILSELRGEADRVEWLVLGIGINANVDAEVLPTGATSVRALRGDVERRIVVATLLETLDRLRDDPDAILERWCERSTTLGRRVRVSLPDREIEGEAIDVEPPGTLLVETDRDGSVERVHAGDCEHLRPADGPD